jgi:hypothetical protein
MYQMRISTNQVSSVVLRPKKLESRKKCVKTVKEPKKSFYLKWTDSTDTDTSLKWGIWTPRSRAKVAGHSQQDRCPAKGKQCTKCKNYNNFSKVCKSIHTTHMMRNLLIQVVQMNLLLITFQMCQKSLVEMIKYFVDWMSNLAQSRSLWNLR